MCTYTYVHTYVRMHSTTCLVSTLVSVYSYLINTYTVRMYFTQSLAHVHHVNQY